MSDYKQRLAAGEMIERLHLDEGNAVVQYAQDVEPILEANRQRQSDPHKGKEMRHIASIPHVVMHQWLADAGLPAGWWLRADRKEKAQFVRKKLNSSEWQWLKTQPGKV